MNIVYRCSRCAKLGNPGPVRREDGPHAIPPMPERWAERVLPSNLRNFPGRPDGGADWLPANVTLCPTCDDELALEVARSEEERIRRTSTTIRDGRKVEPEYLLSIDDIVAWKRRKLIAMRAVNPDPAFPYEPDRTPCALTDSIPGLLAAMEPDEARRHLLNFLAVSMFPGREPEEPAELVRFTRRIRWKGRGFLYAEKGDYGLLLPRPGHAYEQHVFHMRGAGGFSTMGDVHPTQIETP